MVVFAVKPSGMESDGMGFSFSPEPNLSNHIISLKSFLSLSFIITTWGNYSDSVSFKYCCKDQVQNRLKHFVTYKALSTHELLTNIGYAFLLVERKPLNFG